MATTQKALDLAKKYKEEVAQRQSLAVSLEYDTDGNPMVRIGAAVAGAAGALVRFKPVEWALAKDIFGQTAIHYGPHVAQIATEKGAAGVGEGYNSPAQMLAMLAPLVFSGCKVQWIQAVNGLGGGILDETELNAALAATDGEFEDLKYPMVQSQ